MRCLSYFWVVFEVFCSSLSYFWAVYFKLFLAAEIIFSCFELCKPFFSCLRCLGQIVKILVKINMGVLLENKSISPPIFLFRFLFLLLRRFYFLTCYFSLVYLSALLLYFLSSCCIFKLRKGYLENYRRYQKTIKTKNIAIEIVYKFFFMIFSLKSTVKKLQACRKMCYCEWIRYFQERISRKL